MREFKSSAHQGAQQALPNAVEVQFMLDGREITAQPANSGQLAYLVAMQAEAVNPSEQIAAVFDFLQSLLDEEDFDFIRDQMKQGITSAETLLEIVEYLVEEWTTVPTTSAPASSSARRSTGKPSTARARSKA